MCPPQLSTVHRHTPVLRVIAARRVAGLLALVIESSAFSSSYHVAVLLFVFGIAPGTKTIPYFSVAVPRLILCVGLHSQLRRPLAMEITPETQSLLRDFTTDLAWLEQNVKLLPSVGNLRAIPCKPSLVPHETAVILHLHLPPPVLSNTRALVSRVHSSC